MVCFQFSPSRTVSPLNHHSSKLGCFPSRLTKALVVIRGLPNVLIILTISPQVTTFVVSPFHLLMFLGSLFCKKYGPRSDCSQGAVCPGFIFSASIKTSQKCSSIYTADVKSRRHFQDENTVVPTKSDSDVCCLQLLV